MLNVIVRLWSAAPGVAANLLKYPSSKGDGYHAGDNASRQSTYHPAGSPLGDWLTQTVSYHH